MAMWLDFFCVANARPGRCDGASARQLELLGGGSVRIDGGLLSILFFESFKVLLFNGFVLGILFKLIGEVSDFGDLRRMLNFNTWLER